ncbi:esterase/lipase family protein [Nocardia otitidiscaviarum]|uniref:esterase/lipase family protein n=1 Tax=Nocardia otitidiscaviarum TaxID=1823 RepID=UPI001895A751|nr:alpha/beta fold hydrolase [Nocardia otitidiscaviarum]MBF6179504.1 lipase [Nocardia otitidiscaviarum]
MQRGIRTLVGAALTSITAAAVAMSGGAAAAEPEIPATPEGLAHYIESGLAPAADGRTPTFVVDTGSGSGSSSARSFATDTRGSGPEMSSFLAAFAHGLTHPDAAPPGANDWNCRPTAEHPRPVVLVHGTWLNAYDSFAYLSPQLARAGFCVFTTNFGRLGMLDGGGIGQILPGRHGVGPMEDSAKQLGALVDRVLAATGADKVDVIAHSQGGPVTSQYMKFEGGEGKVGKVIGFGATNHGTSLLGIATLGRIITNLGVNILGFYQPILGTANIQQAAGSHFYQVLNANGDTVPGVSYTSVGTRHDQISNPYEWTFLRAGPDATVENITLQQGCEQDFSDHLTIMYSPRALSIALRALDPVAHPELVCSFNPWMIGGGGKL